MSHDIATVDEARSAGLDWLLGIGACVILFGPLLAAGYYYAQPESMQVDAAAETVGVGVILRAMFRRLLRSGARGVMQATVGTVSRASFRTMTRRVVRVGIKSLTTAIRRSPQMAGDAAGDGSAEPDAQPLPLALTTGLLALALSLAGVLLVLDLEQPSLQQAPRLTTVLGGMPFVAAVLLGTLPYAVYAALLLAAAPYCGAQVRFRTGWEALLLQAYFTGSGSYLPLSTDSEISGPQPARMRLALVGLGSLLALHWGFAAAALYFDSYPLQYVAGMFLLYCFVFSFPISPLDGYYLWTSSRWLWLAVWIPILASFILIMPETLHVIL